MSKNTARLKTKSINNINEKLDILKKKVDNFDATDIDAVEDEDPDYSDVDTENNRMYYLYNTRNGKFGYHFAMNTIEYI